MSAPPGPDARTPVVLVRVTRPRDIPRVWELMRELAVYERMEADHTSTPELLAAQLFVAGAWPRIECLVAEVGNEIVGYALFYGNYSSFRGKPVIWLEDLCVTESRRASGAGSALMRALARIAVDRGCARVGWDVLDWNEPSIAFYERLGATRDQGWHGYSLAEKSLEDLARSR